MLRCEKRLRIMVRRSHGSVTCLVKMFCRIEWIKSQCEEYFLNGGKQKYDEREESIRIKMDKDLADIEPFVNYNFNIKNETNHLGLDISFQESNREITLLDVGSCYNPFQTLNMFDVTAIDLNGIPDKVLHCDFLSVPIGTRKILSDDKQEILQLAENSYKVVVFSLFLEYLPCSKQRYICCKKAYNLLESSGIFFIVSPDSKHVNANAKFIKSWRYVLSKLGFMRIKYEKLRHIHCIMFRKCVFKHVAVRWANLQMLAKNDPLYQDQNAIYIPQDFRNVSGEIKQREKENYDTNEMIFMFNELPFGET
ncbi:S-adenosylmethionine sensor upstream of TORC1 isoform X2 [Calliopsis andreniformis]|uniref:S-adenosylmethionine sensor upstream of TORC1 isoform X2 n=1 Tax=Calliopsis andreniformis TaxID=337506 RepID=UPI003FCDB98A